MIREATEDDVEDIFNLVRKVYVNHSLLNREIEKQKELMNSGNYKSFIDIEKGDIIGHAGVFICGKFLLLNSLIVAPNHRGKKIGKDLFEKRLQFCEEQNTEHIVGYSMMQHPKSQLLYPSNFNPIGMIINYSNIYIGKDGQYNQGKSNAEIVLCKTLLDYEKEIIVKSPKKIWGVLEKILISIKIRPKFLRVDDVTNSKNIFLGLNPTYEKGLLNLGFLEYVKNVDFNKMITTNRERSLFKENIRREYESHNLL